MDPAILRRAATIRLLILDVDGVLTDGGLHYDAEGREFKTFHVRDGFGIKRVLEAGIEVAVISGRMSRSTAARMAELGIRHVMLGREDKAAALGELLDRLGVGPEAAACVGDDLPDLAMMQRVALPIAVADCHGSIEAAALWRTTRPGGRGAVREVCDLLLHARAGGSASGR
jgi:3-deoxy-D-manno-octulosonate 8-phosphate phosphatase (KDO 8-P phosphatase)